MDTREPGIYRFGRCSLDPVRRSLFCDGVRIKLAERLFDLLSCLVVNHGRVVERDALLRAVWSGRIVEDSNLGQAVFALRKTLKAQGLPDTIITTVPGRGFRFSEAVVFEPVCAEIPATPDAAPAPSRSGWQRRLVLIGPALSLLLSIGLFLSRTFEAGSGPQAAAPFTPPAHSVAVLAFDNMTGDPAETYLSDGLSEQVIDTLTRIKGLETAARTSAFSFRGGHATAGEIARALNVRSLLAGSVRRSGQRILVTVQLTDALTGFNLWSNSYDRDPSDLISVQAEIAQAVMQSLHMTTSDATGAKLSLGDSTVPAAFDAYLHGLKLENIASDETGYRVALADFDLAVARDPAFARAYAERANALAHIGVIAATADHAARRSIFLRALQDADHAIALAPDLGWPHSVRGIVLDWGFLDVAAAAAEQEKALDLSPGNAAIQTNYATAAMALGSTDQAVAAAQRGCELDPLASDVWGGLARVLYLSRRYDEALEALSHAKLTAKTMPVQFETSLGFIELMRGDYAAALRAAAPGTYFGQIEVLAIAHGKSGRGKEAAAEFEKMHQELGDDGAYNYGQIDAQLGLIDAAFAWLDRAVVLEDAGLIDIRVDPLLDPLRHDPRLDAILRRLSATGVAGSDTMQAPRTLASRR